MMGSDMTRTNAKQSPAQRLWRHAGMAGILGIAVLIGGSVGGSGNLGSFGSLGTAARAQDANDDMPDTKFFRGLLKGLGLRKDGDTIDYRERSPLVLPPGRDLQPPEPEGQAKKTAAWPNDPDVRRAKQRKEQDKKFVREDEAPSCRASMAALIRRRARMADCPPSPRRNPRRRARPRNSEPRAFSATGGRRRNNTRRSAESRGAAV